MSDPIGQPPAATPSNVPPTDNAALDEVLAMLDQQAQQVAPTPTPPPPENIPVPPAQPPIAPPSMPEEKPITPPPVSPKVVSPAESSTPPLLSEDPNISSKPAETKPKVNVKKGLGKGVAVFASLAVLVVLVGGLVLANLAVHQSQNIRPHASTACTNGTVDCSKCSTAG